MNCEIEQRTRNENVVVEKLFYFLPYFFQERKQIYYTSIGYGDVYNLSGEFSSRKLHKYLSKHDICSYRVLSSIFIQIFLLLPFRLFSLDVISGNKGFMLSKLAGCWLAVTWVQNIAEFSDKRRLVCEPRFIASRSSHTPPPLSTLSASLSILVTISTIYTLHCNALGHQTLNLEMGDTEV